MKKPFFKIFQSYIWLGLFIILISIVLKEYLAVDNLGLINLRLVFTELLNAIGIAVFVAAIFSFASGSSAFVTKIRGLLEEVVLSDEFFQNLDDSKKKRLFEAAVRNSSKSRAYTNVESYYADQVSKVLTLDKKCVRSNYFLDAHADKDVEANKIRVRCLASYRLYPNSEGDYDYFMIGFDGYDKKFLPELNFVRMSSQSGAVDRYVQRSIA